MITFRGIENALITVQRRNQGENIWMMGGFSGNRIHGRLLVVFVQHTARPVFRRHSF
ncbi:hypothetical protein ENC_10710 [Enterobacter hormaechei]|nr:hypothetical protein ENC_10710 [Enterobacter hormaechei]